MSRLFKGAYSIRFSNQSYIRAITQYNAKTWIDLIKFNVHPTDHKVKKLPFVPGVSMTQLPEQINQIRSQFSEVQKVEVEYGSADSWAMFNVLHPINAQLYQKFNIVSDVSGGRSLPRTSENVLIDYLSGVIFNSTNLGEMSQILPPLPVCSLSREKAIELVLKQSGSSDLQCIELPELQTIVFGSFSEKAACFYVTYGEKFDADSLDYILFDIDDGFIFKDEAASKAQKIRNAMQRYFEPWKNKNYEGSVFPQELSLGFALTKTPEHEQEIIELLKKQPGVQYINDEKTTEVTNQVLRS